MVTHPAGHFIHVASRRRRSTSACDFYLAVAALCAKMGIMVLTDNVISERATKVKSTASATVGAVFISSAIQIAR
jgi:hypothetical protein